MVPQTWVPFRRPEDDELLGYLDERADGIVPLTVFGAPLGPAGSRAQAEEVLRARGLASLAEPWLLRRDVGDGGDRAARGDGSGDEVRVALVAAYPDRVLVVPAPYGYADPAEPTIVVPATEGATRLRPFVRT